jgi:hypothetical protein
MGLRSGTSYSTHTIVFHSILKSRKLLFQVTAFLVKTVVYLHSKRQQRSTSMFFKFGDGI